MSHCEKLEFDTTNNSVSDKKENHYIASGTGARVVWAEYFIEKANKYNLLKGENILDFGCGFFDVGRRLSDKKNIAGFDIAKSQIKFLRNEFKDNGKFTFYDEHHQIPNGSFNVIIVNSVIQYFSNKDDLAENLNKMKSWLSGHTGDKIILADIIPNKYNSATDALRSLSFSLLHGCALEMFNHLWCAFRHKNVGKFLYLDPKDIEEQASRLGLQVKILPENLSPSYQRFTAVLTVE